jgi:hypothetical protein
MGKPSANGEHGEENREIYPLHSRLRSRNMVKFFLDLLSPMCSAEVLSKMFFSAEALICSYDFLFWTSDEIIE